MREKDPLIVERGIRRVRDPKHESSFEKRQSVSKHSLSFAGFRKNSISRASFPYWERNTEHRVQIKFSLAIRSPAQINGRTLSLVGRDGIYSEHESVIDSPRPFHRTSLFLRHACYRVVPIYDVLRAMFHRVNRLSAVPSRE